MRCKQDEKSPKPIHNIVQEFLADAESFTLKNRGKGCLESFILKSLTSTIRFTLLRGSSVNQPGWLSRHVIFP